MPWRRTHRLPVHTMTTHTSSHPTAHSVRHSLGEAAERADRRLVQAAQACERAHRQVERAVERGLTKGADALQDRRWQGRMDPWVGRLSSSARQLARQGVDLASSAGTRAQESWSRYADATTGYVARQPMRAVLIAAAVGAGLALLLASGRSRRD